MDSSQSEARSILLIDDDERLVRSLARRLRLDGFEVSAVTSGCAALGTLDERNYGAVVLDMRLGDMTADEFLERIAPREVRPPVVILSGHVDVPLTAKLMRLGARDVLEKPASPSEIVGALERALGGNAAGGANKTNGANGTKAGEQGPLRLEDTLVGFSPAMTELRRQIERIARAPLLNVFVHGETGTGKEVVARAIHEARDPKASFVAVNGAAIPSSLFESEFFGHEAGAFTDAKERRAGKFLLAGGGTLFLDEIGEMPEGQQAKLLRVLETRRFMPVGARHEQTFSGRVVSATNRTPGPRGTYGLRSDLFFRLAGTVLQLPPLCARMEDIPALTRHFMRQATVRLGASEDISVEPEAIERLSSYDWPGNIRELRLVLEQAIFWGDGLRVTERDVKAALASRVPEETLRPEPPMEHHSESAPPTLPAGGVPDWLSRARATPAEPIDLRAIENELIVEVFESCEGNTSLASRRLGIPRTTLRDRLKRLGLL